MNSKSTPAPANMSPAPKADWATLQQRAGLMATLRQFFAERHIVEVETPHLYPYANPDPHLSSFSCEVGGERYYLHTSPEHAMKRLLAAHHQPIYQLCKAFRQDEVGQLHSPEFTLLEWYRPGFDHHELMNEVDALLQQLLALLLSHIIEPTLGLARPLLIYDFPASQCALARIRDDTPPVAERFEVYVRGVELANGFHELNEADEQRRRFEHDNQRRQQRGLPQVAVDEDLLAVLDNLPDCAGVALGVDRLIMLALGKSSLSEITALPWAKKNNLSSRAARER